MIFNVFCCTFMNHCNPDSSTKTHISSHTKLFSNNSSQQKIHISSHPEHAFFHKGSHILSSCSANVAQHLEFVAQHFPGPKNQKTKKNQIFPAMVGARIVFFFIVFFWFVVFCFCFFFWVFWSIKWPCIKCMGSIKIHCIYQWFGYMMQQHLGTGGGCHIYIYIYVCIFICVRTMIQVQFD